MSSTVYLNFGGIASRTQDQVQFDILIPIFLLSFLSCTYALILAIRNPELIEAYHNKLILILFFFDGMLNFFDLWPGVYYPGGLCVFQGVMTQIFSFAGIIWTFVIGISLYAKICHDKYINIPLAFCCVLIIAILSAILPFSSGEIVYGSAGGWCWYLQKDKTNWYFQYYRFFLFYIPTWIIIVSNWLLYGKILIVNRRNHGSNEELANEAAQNLKYYPLILFFCYIPLTIKRIMQSNSNIIPFEFDLWSSIWIRLLGFFNVLAYMMKNAEIKRYLNQEIEINEEVNQA